MDARKLWTVAILVFLAVGVVTLGVRPMVVPDEPRYGIIPAEMVARGDWLTLRMNGLAYWEKPPLGYWLTAASISVLGETPFAIRLPSALASCVTALCAAWLAARISGRREDGPLAFLVQATTLGPLVLGTVALLDPPFAACIALTMAAFFGACTSSGRARAGWLALAGAAAGLGFLTKGLLAFALPGVAAVAFLAWERRWRDLLTMPWIPLAAAALTIAPFAWMVERAQPGFWEYFIVVEHFRRAVRPDANQHPEPWWHFIAVFPVGAMLWTLAWPNALKGLRGAAEWGTGVRFMVSWVVGPIALLSLSSGKLPTYILPMFAPVAVLVVLGLRRGRETGAVRLDGAALGARWALRAAAVACFAVAAVGIEAFGAPTLWSSGQGVRFALFGVALLAWAQADAWAWRAEEGPRWLARTAVAPLAMLVLVPWVYPEAALKASKHPWPALERHAADLAGASFIAAGCDTAHAVCWVARRHDVTIGGAPSEFDNELGRPEDAGRILRWPEVAAKVAAARPSLVAYSSTPSPVAVVCAPAEAEQILAAPGVPAPAVHDTDGNVSILIWH
ncbi:MAG: phospholipid carrier-dependent glycosyltransferase [Planctomycetota bacterium]